MPNSNLISEDFEMFASPRSAEMSITVFDIDHEEAWNEIIDYKLLEWRNECEGFEDGEYEPPSLKAIDAGIRLAQVLKKQTIAPPQRVVPDGDGGISFEFKQDRELVTFEIDAEGNIEAYHFRDAMLKERISVA
jgi:hypothetical protein